METQANLGQWTATKTQLNNEAFSFSNEEPHALDPQSLFLHFLALVVLWVHGFLHLSENAWRQTKALYKAISGKAVSYSSISSHLGVPEIGYNTVYTTNFRQSRADRRFQQSAPTFDQSLSCFFRHPVCQSPQCDYTAVLGMVKVAFFPPTPIFLRMLYNPPGCGGKVSMVVPVVTRKQ